MLKSKTTEVARFSLFVKTFLSTLLPYPSDGILAESDIDKHEFKRIFNNIDYSRVESKQKKKFG